MPKLEAFGEIEISFDEMRYKLPAISFLSIVRLLKEEKRKIELEEKKEHKTRKPP